MDTIDRRSFLRYSAVAGVAASASVLGAGWSTRPATGSARHGVVDRDFPWLEATIWDMQIALETGEATALSITRDHLERIERVDWDGPRINSIIEVNPDAEAIAAALDDERVAGHVRGPLHGIPVVLKDCIATADGMQTTAGSLALVGSKVPRDAGVAARLREAGAVLLGKANMSEWNAFRGWPTRGGWSARAGVGRNPYALNYSTGDSSSGSAAAVAASLAAGAVGLETYGSIVMPSSLCGVVGLKPTAGLISRSGTIPISFTRDAIGPMARTVRDVALLLDGMVGADPLDPVTRNLVDGQPPDHAAWFSDGALLGARIGVWRHRHLWKDEPTARVIEEALSVLREQGAQLIDPIDIRHWLEATGHHVEVMSTEFRHGIRRYLDELTDTEIRTLDDVVAFNEAHRREELRWHPQNILEGALESPPLSDGGYRKALRLSERLGRDGIDAAMREHRLDAIVAPTFVRSWPIDLIDGDPPVGNGVAGPSNAAGYPNLTVPAGSADGLPIGISFLGRAWQERRLLRYGFAFEQASHARHAPRYLDAGGEFVPR